MCCRANIPMQGATLILFWSQTVSKHRAAPDFVVLSSVLWCSRGHVDLLGNEEHLQKALRHSGEESSHQCYRKMPTKDMKICSLLWQKWRELTLLTLTFPEWRWAWIWVPVSFLHKKCIFADGEKCLFCNVTSVDYTTFPMFMISFLYWACHQCTVQAGKHSF